MWFLRIPILCVLRGKAAPGCRRFDLLCHSPSSFLYIIQHYCRDVSLIHPIILRSFPIVFILEKCCLRPMHNSNAFQTAPVHYFYDIWRFYRYLSNGTNIPPSQRKPQFLFDHEKMNSSLPEDLRISRSATVTFWLYFLQCGWTLPQEPPLQKLSGHGVGLVGLPVPIWPHYPLKEKTYDSSKNGAGSPPRNSCGFNTLSPRAYCLYINFEL